MTIIFLNKVFSVFFKWDQMLKISCRIVKINFQQQNTNLIIKFGYNNKTTFKTIKLSHKRIKNCTSKTV